MRGTAILLQCSMAAAAALALGGCSFTFDDDAPDVVEVGGPGPLAGPRVRVDGIVLGASLKRGFDGAPWLMVQAYPGGKESVSRAVRLVHPAAEVAYGSAWQLTRSAIVLYASGEQSADPVRVTLRPIGATAGGDSVELPTGDAEIDVDYDSELVVYWPHKSNVFLLYRPGRGLLRVLPVPTAIDDDRGPRLGADLLIEDSGEHVFTLERCEPAPMPPSPCARLIVHATEREEDIVLDQLTRRFLVTAIEVVAAAREVLVCDGRGLRVIALDGKRRRTLDPEPCTELYFRRRGAGGYSSIDGDDVLYLTGSPLANEMKYFAVRYDGGGPPRRLHDGRHLLLDVTPRAVAHTTSKLPKFYDPEEGEPAHDGWVGEWRFMERGIAAGFSRDGARVRFLEHAARAYVVGDLRSAQIGDERALRLARNVRRFVELPDGRVLAAADQPFIGPHNRIVVIDEERRTLRSLAEGASRFLHEDRMGGGAVAVTDVQGGKEYVWIDLPPRAQ